MKLTVRQKLRDRAGRTRLEVDLDLPHAGVTAFLGPSGAGKTTLLRCLAGLEPAARGRVALDGRIWQDSDAGVFEPPHRRGVGYVFQDGVLFPHLTVRGNLAFGARRRGPQDAVALEETAAMLGLAPLLDRRPDTLSGGERQRAALARALLSRPRLLLLDEPLASLDRDSRRRILPYLEEVRRRVATPILLVTHELDEAARLADHLVRLECGRALGAGPLPEMLAAPDPGLALDEDAGAVLAATVGEHLPEDGLVRLRRAGGELLVPDPGLAAGAALRVRIRARDVSLALHPATDSSILNVLPAEVLDLLVDGEARVVVRLRSGDDVLLAAVTRRSARRLELRPGAQVYAQVKSVAVL